MPSYFTYGLKNGVYTLSGEGEGNKQASAAAFEDLKKLSGPDIKMGGFNDQVQKEQHDAA